MINRLLILVFTLLCLGCASKIELIGRTDFNPIYEWTPAVKVFVQPDSDSISTSSNLPIEAKLARIAKLAGNRAGLSFIDDPEQADAFMFVKYRRDTISYVAPALSYTYGSSTVWNYHLTKQIGANSYDWTVTVPSFEKRIIYITVELLLREKFTSSIAESEESIVRMVSYAINELGRKDHNRLTYHLLVACIKSIPGADRDFDSDVPRLNLVLAANWLSGIRAWYISNDGSYVNPPSPFKWNDLIYQINSTRIYDYFDYVAFMYMLPVDTKTCNIKFNRRGKLMETEYKF